MSKAGDTKALPVPTAPSGFSDIRIVSTLAQTQGKPSEATWILCPWYARFSGDRSHWLSVLAAHDANGTLLEALRPSETSRPNVYAAVFAVDALRGTAQLIRHVKNAGIGGVINFPSISFIDGEAGTILDRLSLGVNRELEFLETCSKDGLRIAGVVCSVPSAKRLLAAGADFLIVHGGPPVSGEKDAGKHLAMKLAELVRSKSVPVMPMSHLLWDSHMSNRDY
jgi:predicted TIM-barrel enzyme